MQKIGWVAGIVAGVIIVVAGFSPYPDVREVMLKAVNLIIPIVFGAGAGALTGALSSESKLKKLRDNNPSIK